MSEETLSNLLSEDRRFEPPAELAANANLQAEAYERAASDREAFWAEHIEPHRAERERKVAERKARRDAND